MPNAGPVAGGRHAVARSTFFTSRHGRGWRCATCHRSTPAGAGGHVVTGKAIEPIAPAFNPARFTDGA
ncbi:DUF1924 domain-containing protein [Burkholderia thailandensis]|uniref:DUF1924 domain-containing protein n=1 Tax=Burkholderia thailandensis TaxID=57975 RepID=UPI00358DCE3F